jgi:hypothetical protein
MTGTKSRTACKSSKRRRVVRIGSFVLRVRCSEADMHSPNVADRARRDVEDGLIGVKLASMQDAKGM